jgi:ATP-dependent RNA helicase DHX57
MGRGLIVDGWFCLQGWARIGVLVSRLRLLLDNVLASRIDNPSLSLADSQPKSSILCYENRVIDLVKRLIEFNGLDQ